MDNLTKKTNPTVKKVINDGLNFRTQALEELELEHRGFGNKRPKIGAMEEKDLQESARNINAKEMEDVEKGGEIDDWKPPCDQKGDGKTDLNSKYGY